MLSKELTSVSTPEKGFDEPLGRLGARLSGGEKKRLALARTLLQRPEVLILDEITSALDEPGSAGLLERLGIIRQTCSLIVISHRPATILWADRILVIDQGTVAGSGKHNELLVTCDAYRRIWQLQAAYPGHANVQLKEDLWLGEPQIRVARVPSRQNCHMSQEDDKKKRRVFYWSDIAKQAMQDWQQRIGKSKSIGMTERERIIAQLTEISGNPRDDCEADGSGTKAHVPRVDKTGTAATGRSDRPNAGHRGGENSWAPYGVGTPDVETAWSQQPSASRILHLFHACTSTSYLS